ncbi:hypothetical protein T05_8364 [Trichinella murrelli]|uniref:Uncharacterized protein n=1 Tax=Trichinella murrelli TaxID=144512 RepID=A0A0V0T9E7_9BILA|nr:hypothetical protein T05_8364 [Trichinella murrelli]
MIITLAYLKCWLSVNERRNILVGVTHPLEQSWQDSGRAKTRRTAQRKITATDNRGPKTASCVPTEKGVFQWHPVPCAHHFSAHIALSEKGTLLAHLCRWSLRTPSTPTVLWPASLPHQVIHRISPSQPGVGYEALTLPLAVLKLGALCVHHYDPLSFVPPEISTCVSVLFTDLDLCMHLLNVRLQPDSLSGGGPPTGRYGWWVLLPAGRSTKFFRSALSRRIQQSFSSFAFSPVDSIGGWYFVSSSAQPCVIKTVLVTSRQVSLNCPEPPYGLLEVDQNVRLVPAEREAVLLPISVEGQGILELFHHPCKFLVGNVYRVISIAWISQNLPNDASANPSIFVKKILVSAAGSTQSCNIFSARGSVASLLIRRVTKSALGYPVPQPKGACAPRAHILETSLAINGANTHHCLLLCSGDRIGSLGVLGCKRMRAIIALPNRLSHTDALLLPGPAPIRPGVRLTLDLDLAADEINIPDP